MLRQCVRRRAQRRSDEAVGEDLEVAGRIRSCIGRIALQRTSQVARRKRARLLALRVSLLVSRLIFRVTVKKRNFLNHILIIYLLHG